MRTTTWYISHILFLTGVDNGEETCSSCEKNSTTMGQHIEHCTAKLTQESFQVVSNHGNDIFSLETIENLIVNIKNQYQLEAPEGILK